MHHKRRKRPHGYNKTRDKRKTYEVRGMVRMTYGGFETQSVRQLLKQSFWKEYESAYG